MGSYAKYQERLAAARENMQRRKNINLGHEVMLVPLKQEVLYCFQDAPTTEEKLDNILSKLVRKERAMAAAEVVSTVIVRAIPSTVTVSTGVNTLAVFASAPLVARYSTVIVLPAAGETPSIPLPPNDN